MSLNFLRKEKFESVLTPWKVFALKVNNEHIRSSLWWITISAPLDSCPYAASPEMVILLKFDDPVDGRAMLGWNALSVYFSRSKGKRFKTCFVFFCLPLVDDDSIHYARADGVVSYKVRERRGKPKMRWSADGKRGDM